jgi:hypothetical protein
MEFSNIPLKPNGYSKVVYEKGMSASEDYEFFVIRIPKL